MDIIKSISLGRKDRGYLKIRVQLFSDIKQKSASKNNEMIMSLRYFRKTCGNRILF